MDEEKELLPESSEEKPKSAWQLQKESFYDRIPVTVKQLDVIIWLATAGLVIVTILIALDAMNII